MEKKNDKFLKCLLEILNQFDFKDFWYFKNLYKDGCMWCDFENIFKSRIDYIFVKNINLNQIKIFVVRYVLGMYNNNIRMSDYRYLKICVNFNILE